MSKLFFRALMVAGVALILMLPLLGQQTQQMERPEDNLSPADFTDIIKGAWTFLKDETDALLNSTAKKTEFETSQEFQQRVSQTRKEYLAKVVKFSQDKKFEQREFGILFKADLISYDADNRTYRVTSKTTVEIPYDIPWLDVSLDENPLVSLADSIARGYRSTSMYLKMTPALRYEVPMDLARSVKSGEDQLYFRVRLTMNMIQEDFRNEARLSMTAYHIQLFNRATNVVYWEQNL